MDVFVELSGESQALAMVEVGAAAEALGGGGCDLEADAPGLVRTHVPDGAAEALAGRLALARRCLVECRPGWDRAGPIGLSRPVGDSASFRLLGRPSGGGRDRPVRAAAERWKAAGGTIDLGAPHRRFWLSAPTTGPVRQFEEVAAVDRRAVRRRRISALPFRRPVGLDPRLARAAANLARAAPGRRVVDPFLGTGALLAEAALLGARVTGVDHEPAMVRGALQNFAHLGVTAERLVVADAGAPEVPDPSEEFDALLSDPPYGRASSTGGEETTDLLARVLPPWADRVVPSGYVVLVVPGGPDPLPSPWRRVVNVSVRAHRSLTREFRVYRRGPTAGPDVT